MPQHSARPSWTRWLASLVLGLPLSVLAAPGDQLAALAPKEATEIRDLVLEGLPGAAALSLRRFEVWAPDARIVVQENRGAITRPPPAHRYFRGQLNGRPDSTAYLSLRADGTVKGLIANRTGLWMVDEARGRPSWSAWRVDDHPALADAARGFSCTPLDPNQPTRRDRLNLSQARTLPGYTPPRFDQALPWRQQLLPLARNTSLPTLTARLAIETDQEYLALFNGDAEAATTYITDLVAFSSTIYAEEVGTDLSIVHLSLWDTTDPWSQNSTTCTLLEFGGYWNQNHSDIDRTAAHFVSGRFNGGIAWVGTLCSGSFNYNHGGICPGLPNTGPYGGDYAVSGGIDGNFDIDNPGMVWDLTVFSHELGHNFNSPHTHCYAGIGGNSNPVDQCYGAQSGCYAGSASLPGPAGAGSGTIMSYCHLLNPGMSNIGATFGLNHPYGNEPQRVPNWMRNYAESVASQNPACLVPPAESFGLSADPAELFACRSDSGFTADPVDIEVLSFGGFDNMVTLSLDPLPGTGWNHAFSPNPITPDQTSTLLLSGDASVATGQYSLTIKGSAIGSEDVFLPLDMTIGAPLSVTPQPALPEHNATQISIVPVFEWSPVTGADEYRLEVATDPAFANTVLDRVTAGTEFVADTLLAADTTHYWRVTPVNACGPGDTSPVQSFTTQAAFCTSPNASIPQDDTDGVSDTLNLAVGGTIDDLKVHVQASHTWVGDLVFTLTRVDTSTTVALIDRPGVDASDQFGCDGDDIAVLLDDDAPVSADSLCNSPPQTAIAGIARPSEPLAAFDNQPLSGSWTLTAADKEGFELPGTLQTWCLVPMLSDDAVILRDDFETR